MWMVLTMMLRQVSGAPACSAISASRIQVSLEMITWYCDSDANIFSMMRGTK